MNNEEFINKKIDLYKFYNNNYINNFRYITYEPVYKFDFNRIKNYDPEYVNKLFDNSFDKLTKRVIKKLIYTKNVLKTNYLVYLISTGYDKYLPFINQHINDDFYKNLAEYIFHINHSDEELFNFFINLNKIIPLNKLIELKEKIYPEEREEYENDPVLEKLNDIINSRIFSQNSGLPEDLNEKINSYVYFGKSNKKLKKKSNKKLKKKSIY